METITIHLVGADPVTHREVGVEIGDSGVITLRMSDGSSIVYSPTGYRWAERHYDDDIYSDVPQAPADATLGAVGASGEPGDPAHLR